MRRRKLFFFLSFSLVAAVTTDSPIWPASVDSADGTDTAGGQSGTGGFRTGEFELTTTVGQLTSPDSARVIEPVISADEPVGWAFYVPARYQPEHPPGLMVYISPSPSGRIPRGWKPIMDKRNLIWIAANRSGNRIMPARRALFALVAPTLVSMHYEIDRARIYLSGLSGGGKMAGMVAADYPQLFKGSIFNCGINPLDEHPPRQLESFKRNHFVFITGSRDQALQRTKRVYREYLESGIENSKLMVIRDMPHQNPNGPNLDQAIEYLDSRAAPKDTADERP